MARVLGWTRPSKFLFPDSIPTAIRSPCVRQEKNQVRKKRYCPGCTFLAICESFPTTWMYLFKLPFQLVMSPIGCPCGRYSGSEDTEQHVQWFLLTRKYQVGQKATSWLFCCLGPKNRWESLKVGSSRKPHGFQNSYKANQIVFLNTTEFVGQKSSQCNVVYIHLCGDFSGF